MKRLVLVALFACVEEPSPDVPPTVPPRVVTPGELDGACPLATRLGGFAVSAGPLYSFVEGKVADGVVPLTVLDDAGTFGPCQLLRRPSLVCDPTCQAGDTCDRGGECIAYPRQQNAGHVSVYGLRAAVEMDPLPPGNNYSATQVPHPLFEPGAPLLLETLDGFFGALELSGDGVTLLDEPDDWVLAPGAPLVIGWNTAAEDARSSIVARLTVDQHGTSPVSLVCRFAETDTGEVPADAVDALLESGISGFPNGSLTRETADSIDSGSGCVDLRVISSRAASVEVAGHIPCNASTPCPSPLECNLALEQCE
jgi:hypothetical protein